MRDIKAFHTIFYKENNKVKQDTIITQFCKPTTPKKRRMENQPRSRRNLTFKYFTGNYIPVCRDTFLNIVGIKRDRLQGVLRRFYVSGGEIPKETKGGDRRTKKNGEKLESVCNFIESLEGKEPQYCRGKSQNRL